MSVRTLPNHVGCAAGLCVTLFVAIAQAANTPSKFKSDHQAAAKLLHAEQWNQAEAVYRGIIEKGLEDSLVLNAQLGLAQSLFGLKKYDKAFGAFQNVSSIVESNHTRHLTGRER